LVLYLGLTLLPFLVALPMLFTDQLDFQDTSVNNVGFANFGRIFTDPNVQREYWPSLLRTAQFTGLNYLMVYVFGLSLALIVYEIGFQSGFFTIIYLPMMVSALALGYMADMLFAQTTGTANLILKALGSGAIININQPAGVAVVLPLITGWRWAGFNMAVFLSGLLSIPSETIEAATVDGASYWQRLRYVYFPQMVPSFIIATIFCIVGSFGIFDEAVALGALMGNPEAKFLAILFFQYAFSGVRSQLALSMTMALETFLPLIVLAMFLQWLQRRFQYE